MQSATTAKTIDPRFLAGKKFAVVVSRFNGDVCAGLLKGALDALAELGVARASIEVLHVPGAFEIPLIAKKAALTGRFAGVIALGAVIRGETPHFEFVSLAATMGCLQAGLDTGCPVMFGVITVNNPAQAKARAQADEFNKGREAALALAEVLQTMERI